MLRHKTKLLGKRCMWLLGLLMLTLLAACNADRKSPVLELAPLQGLTSIEVSPADLSIPTGLNQQFTALGINGNGTTQDITAMVSWESSVNGTATIDNSSGATHGLATTQATGSTQISATLDGITGATTLEVNTATLSSIVVTPDIADLIRGLSLQFEATANYSDGSAFDVTNSVVWTSTDTDVATMSPNGNAGSGLATGQAAGTAQIRAELDNISAEASLTVTAATLNQLVISPLNSSVIVDNNKQFTATGTFDDGSSVDLTSEVNWASSDNTIALPNASGNNLSGLVAGISAGTVEISANFSGIVAQTPLTVIPSTLDSITVSPVATSVSMGLTQQFKATGQYSNGATLDISDAVTWASADIQIATMNPNFKADSGLATGVAKGDVRISATLDSTSGEATLTVTDATLESINVRPLDPTIVEGLTQQFAATGIFSDASTEDLTTVANWTSGDLNVASMNPSLEPDSGLATGLSAGTALIQASFDGKTGGTTLTVTAETLDSIAVTPAEPTIRVDGTQQFVATGTYSGGSILDITSAVAWTSSDTAVAVMNPSKEPDSGLAKALAEGTATITAELDTIQGSTILTVDPALADNPQAPDMGELQRFVMIASQAITTTPGSAIADGDLALLDQARSFYAGFTNGAVAGEFDELTNGVSYAPDDTTPPYVIPEPYASTVAFINQVRTDLGNAATFLAADPNPGAATQVMPTELGTLTLTRGVYRTADNVIIEQGDLTLDAEGDEDSVFIFVTAGTLTTGAPGGNVILIGGAKASNVYWRTSGKTVLGSNTSFAGNIFASPQINLLTGTEVTGRLFSVTEQVTLDANTVTKPQ